MWPFSEKKQQVVHPKMSPSREAAPKVMAFLDEMKQLFDGEAFPGGFGAQLEICDENGYIDYATLRNRSIQLFTENLYAFGLVGRLLTNLINTGLVLEAEPKIDILGMESTKAREWGSKVESLFSLYCKQRGLVDHQKLLNFPQLQSAALLTAYISGDCLVLLVVDSETKMPTIRLIDGRYVESPLSQMYEDRKIIHGVELDENDRQTAFWVRQADELEPVRHVAYSDTDQPIAWLLYAGRKRLNQVRGVPLLASAMQALSDIKKYTDAEVRSAWVNALFSLWIKREPETVGTNDIFGRAASQKSTMSVTNEDGTEQETKINYMLPGIMLGNLAPGEVPVSFDTSRPNINHNDFVKGILSGVAWANEIPPETLFLQYQSNFSASRQADTEMKMFMSRFRSEFSSQFCQPFYQLWLFLAVLQGKIPAARYVESVRKKKLWDIRAAWENSFWSGPIRPSVDVLKEVNAVVKQIELGILSREEAVKKLSGADWWQTMQRIASEKEAVDDILDVSRETSEDVVKKPQEGQNDREGAK